VNALLPESVIGRQLNSSVRICPTDGTGSVSSPPCHATRMPLRLMFSVYKALRPQSAGDVTWHRSWISILGLSRRLIFFMRFASTLARVAR
jgi:hypothetical protein